MLFSKNNHNQSSRHAQIYAWYEIAFTVVDFLAAFLFLVGSVMFLDEARHTAATWCFISGSVFFALKPSIRISREIHYMIMGDVEDLAKRYRR